MKYASLRSLFLRAVIKEFSGPTLNEGVRLDVSTTICMPVLLELEIIAALAYLWSDEPICEVIFP